MFLKLFGIFFDKFLKLLFVGMLRHFGQEDFVFAGCQFVGFGELVKMSQLAMAFRHAGGIEFDGFVEGFGSGSALF